MVWGKKRGVDDIIKALKENSTSETLWIPPTRDFASNVEAFCDALATNTSLKELACSGHAVSAVGATAFAKALHTNTTLVSLSFGNNSFGDACAEAFFGNFDNDSLRVLDMEFKSIGPRGCTAISTALANPDTRFGIQELKLGRNAIGPDGILALAPGLAANATLVKLDLSDCGIHGNTTCELTKALLSSPLAELDLSRNPKLDAEGASGIARALAESPSALHATLTTLVLNECAIGDDGFVQLVNSLGQVEGLKELHLNSNGITCRGLREAFEDVQQDGHFNSKLPTLATLKLSRNAISVDGAHAIAKALRESSTLKHLDLSINKIQHPAEDLDTMFSTLLSARCLASLDLLGNALGDDGANLLVGVLQNDNPLAVLSLSGSGLTDRGVANVLEALMENQCLCTLELGGNEINDLAEAAIEKLKECNPKLDIARNNGTGGEQQQ